MAEVTFTRKQFWDGDTRILAWVEFSHVNASNVATTYYWAGEIANHPSTYYGGRKDGRILRFGGYSRGLSDYRSGQLEGFTFVFELSDTDSVLRAMLADANQKYMLFREVTIRTIDKASADAGLEPKVVARGIIKGYEATAGKGWVFSCEDLVTLKLQETVPRRLFGDGSGIAATVNIGLPEPIVYGTWTGQQWKCTYVGNFSHDSQTWARCIIAGHAVKAVTDIFLNGSSVFGSVGITWNVFRAAVIGGRTYSYVECYGPDQSTIQGGGEVTVTFTGVEDKGDGTGTLISSGYEQYRHFMNNFVFGNYQTGTWSDFSPGVGPTWADGTAKVKAATFTATDAAWDLAFAAYVGAWGVRDLVSVREQVARMNVSTAVRSGFTRAGEFFITLPKRAWAVGTAVDTITEVSDVKEGSFGFVEYPSGRELINYVTYVYKPRHAGSGEDFLSLGLQTNTTSITNDRVTKPISIEIYMLRDATLASIVAALQNTIGDRTRVAKMMLGLFFLNYQLGDVFAVTHSEGPGASGYAAQKMMWEHEQLDLDSHEIAADFDDCFTT